MTPRHSFFAMRQRIANALFQLKRREFRERKWAVTFYFRQLN
jgi:hypothetical protein